jgi:hypothetical protein
MNSLEMQAMMYEVMVKVSDAHPLMHVIGFFLVPKLQLGNAYLSQIKLQYPNGQKQI